jgi:hypothetical protein
MRIVATSLLLAACGGSEARVDRTQRPSSRVTTRHVSRQRLDLRWTGDPADSWVSIDSMKTRLDIATVAIGIRSVKGQVSGCGSRARVKGTVKLRLSVLPDGRVASATIATTPDQALGACLVAALRSAVFPESDLGGSFTYPFEF